MATKPYRSQKIKHFDQEILVDRVRGRRVVVGTDVGKTRMVSAFAVDGEVLARVRWQSPGEQGSFVALVRRLSVAAECVETAQEPTGSYGDPLRYALESAGLPVYRVSPKHVHDYREVFDGVPSSLDPKASDIICDLHRHGRSVRWVDRDVDASSQLRVCEVYERHFQALQGRLEARLARVWPELPSIVGLDTSTLLQLLSQYGGPSAVLANAAEAEALMTAKGRRVVERNIPAAVVASAHSTIGVPTTASEEAELRLLCTECQTAKTRLREAKRALVATTASKKSVEAMTVIVGAYTASALWVLLGDPAGFSAPRAFVKAAGLNLRENSSGNRQQRGVGITKRGSGRARRLLYFATMRLIQREPWAAAWHESKRSRDGGKGMKSVTALTRKLLKALWHVTRGATFDPTKLFDCGRLKGWNQKYAERTGQKTNTGVTLAA